MLRNLYLLAFLFISTTSLYAQEITRIALLDYNAVFNEFPRQSQKLQKVEELKAEVQEKIDNLKNKLMDLQKEYQQLDNNSTKARRIQKEIEKQKEYGRKYIESKNEEIKVLQKRASKSSRSEELQKLLPDIIAQVAREQGYSMVFDKNSQNIIWFDISIDITEIIIRRLQDSMK